MPAYNGKATDFVNFTRGSLATVTDSDGKIKWAPHNLLTNSESFGASTWGTYLATVSSNTQSAPNGTTTADTLTASAGNDVHRVQRSGDVTIGAFVNCSFSIFVKAGTHNFVTIGFYSASEVFVSATFNLASGSAATETDVGTTSGTIVSTEKVDVGTGWYRLTITGNYSGSAALSFVNFAQAATGNSYTNFGQPVVNLVGTETFHLWGAHVYRSDLGGMQSNGSAYPTYNPTTPKNLLGSTEDFTSGSGWQHNAVSVTKNATIAPNGTQIANKIVETSANSQHYITVSLTLLGIYTFSVYAKAAERTHINLWFNSFGSGAAYFNLTNGTYTLNAGNYVVAADMISIGGGWYRCSIKSATFPSGSYFPVIGVGDTQTYVGDTTKGVYVWGAQLSDSASLDPYVANHFAAPTSAAYYGPRLDYDPVTLTAKGLLIEQARTNLRVWSSAFNNADWSKPNTSVSPDVIASPDGTLTADLITSTASNSGYVQSITYGTTVGATYTLSGYFKAGSQKYVTFYDESSGLLAAYDLEAGTVVSGGANASIIPVGNSWFRCIRVTTYNLANYKQISISGGTLGLGGNWPTSTSFYAWGIQIEAGAFATSYIPTGASTVDRNADVASVSAHAFPYNGAEGTLLAYADWTNAAVATLIYQRIALMGSPADPYARSIQRQDTSTTGVGLFYRGMSTGVDIATSGNSAKIGLAWSSTGGSGSVNGSAASSLTGTPTSSDGLPINILRIGNANDGTFFNGHIREISYLPRRVTNEELQQRTL